MKPFIYEKTKDGEVMYDVFSRLVKDRIVFLEGEIDSDIATTVSATLLFLAAQDPTKLISLYINSPGGLVHPGLFTIYDTMSYINAPVQTVCIGEAYSAASMLLAAGTPGNRLAFENADIMIHEVQAGTIGASSKIERDAARIKRTNDKLIRLLAKHTKQTEKTVRELCEKDTYFSASEAVKFGLIDRVVKTKSFNFKKDVSNAELPDLDSLDEPSTKSATVNPKKKAKKKV